MLGKGAGGTASIQCEEATKKVHSKFCILFLSFKVSYIVDVHIHVHYINLINVDYHSSEQCAKPMWRHWNAGDEPASYLKKGGIIKLFAVVFATHVQCISWLQNVLLTTLVFWHGFAGFARFSMKVIYACMHWTDMTWILHVCML